MTFNWKANKIKIGKVKRAQIVLLSYDLFHISIINLILLSTNLKV